MFGTGRVFKVGVSTLLTDESLPMRKEENGGKVRAEQHRQRQLSVHESMRTFSPPCQSREGWKPSSREHGGHTEDSQRVQED